MVKSTRSKLVNPRKSTVLSIPINHGFLGSTFPCWNFPQSSRVQVHWFQMKKLDHLFNITITAGLSHILMWIFLEFWLQIWSSRKCPTSLIEILTSTSRNKTFYQFECLSLEFFANKHLPQSSRVKVLRSLSNICN